MSQIHDSTNAPKLASATKNETSNKVIKTEVVAQIPEALKGSNSTEATKIAPKQVDTMNVGNKSLSEPRDLQKSTSDDQSSKHFHQNSSSSFKEENTNSNELKKKTSIWKASKPEVKDHSEEEKTEHSHEEEATLAHKKNSTKLFEFEHEEMDDFASAIA